MPHCSAWQPRALDSVQDLRQLSVEELLALLAPVLSRLGIPVEGRAGDGCVTIISECTNPRVQLRRCV